jgi:hypothetical protein
MICPAPDHELTPQERYQERVKDAAEVMECALRGEYPPFIGLDGALREQDALVEAVRAGRPHEAERAALQAALDKAVARALIDPEVKIAEMQARLAAI